MQITSQQQEVPQVSPHEEMPRRPVSLTRQPVGMGLAGQRGMSQDRRA